MPFSGSTVLLVFAVILAMVGIAGGALAVGGIACLLEAYIIYRSGQG